MGKIVYIKDMNCESSHTLVNFAFIEGGVGFKIQEVYYDNVKLQEYDSEVDVWMVNLCIEGLLDRLRYIHTKEEYDTWKERLCNNIRIIE